MDVKISELLTAAAPEKLPCPAECDSAALREAVMRGLRQARAAECHCAG